MEMYDSHDNSDFFWALHADLFQSNVNLAQVLLEPRSLLVMSGEAYELYVHRIDHAKARDEDEKGQSSPGINGQTFMTFLVSALIHISVSMMC